jgi:hypothetical protein
MAWSAASVAALVLAFLVGRTATNPRKAYPIDASQTDTVLSAMERILRRDGLTAALDSLDARAVRDSSLLAAGHQMSHALGRKAVNARAGDPGVLAECRPAFASGCYHGVVEAALQIAGRIDMTRFERLCMRLADSTGPAASFECLHGVGHGVLGARAFDLRATLHDCDALSTTRRATSCHLGAFMEAVNVALGELPLASNGQPVGHDAMHHSTSRAPLAIDPLDPYSPCRNVEEPYASSCWLFQGFVILRGTGFDAGRALAVCDSAPPGRVARCYESIGHQITGLFQRDDAWILGQCGRGRAGLAGHCAAGATLALDAMDWSGRRAMRLCAAAPGAWKNTCYRTAANGLTDLATPARRATLCDSVEPAFVGICREAGDLEISRRLKVAETGRGS